MLTSNVRDDLHHMCKPAKGDQAHVNDLLLLPDSPLSDEMAYYEDESNTETSLPQVTQDMQQYKTPNDLYFDLFAP